MNTDNVLLCPSCVGVSAHSFERTQALLANQILTPGSSLLTQVVADFPGGDDDDLDEDDDLEDDDFDEDDDFEDDFDEEDVEELGFMEDIDEKELEEPFYEEDFEEELEEEEDFDDEL